tara:strand:+ start:1473 stop:1919 length:447 start_codon:yes stop_codon:yes gene_type:complete
MANEKTSTLKIKPRFYVDKECNWFQDGKPITHKRIYKYNYENLKFSNGLFYVQEGQQKAYIYFEDRPYMVKSVNFLKEKKIIINLNDYTFEELNLESLYFDNNIPYCRVKKNEFEAKFSRSSLHQLSKEIIMKKDNFYLFGKKINIKG